MLLQPLSVGKVEFNNLKQTTTSVAETSDNVQTTHQQQRYISKFYIQNNFLKSIFINVDKSIALRNLRMRLGAYTATNSSFLANASVTLSNIAVDENGNLSIPEKDISELTQKFGMVEICLVGDNSEEGSEHDGEEIVMKTFWFGSSGKY